MIVGPELFVGRKTELARAEGALERAAAGDGALLLFSGEAGLGKTRLAQAIARRAGESGARVVWGRAWEAGGAPSYWPWIQIFRALGAPEDPFRGDAMTGTLELAQARFATFDRAARWLERESKESALVVVLDDLHAADVPSLLFLHFVARDLGRARLLILGTYRDVEARLAPEVGPLLAKIAREGEAIALERLSRSDVLEWICSASGEAPEAARAEAERVHATSEGNALYVHELLRMRTPASPALATSAPGLREILDEHLARLGPSAREVLAIASVLGRDLDAGLLVTLSERTHDEVDGALREATQLGIAASPSGGERLSFAHILLRERLYAELVPSRRAALHAAAAEAILAGGGDLATAAHHLLESSSPTARIAEVAHDAAGAALARLAFEEAARLCERALARHAADDAVTTDLELTLGEALMRTGKPDAARAACVRATARAKAIGSAERQAHAALTYGLELLSGAVDPTMVALLRSALGALSEDDSPLRARVLARLSSALVPTPSPEAMAEVLTLSMAGIAMARRTGDDETLLYALQFGGAGFGYLVSAEERAKVTLELVAVAESLGRPLVRLSIGALPVATLREQGALVEADVALAKYEALLDDFPQPNYQWRRLALHVTLACLAGDFVAADRASAELLAMAEAHDIRAGLLTWCLLRFAIAHHRGDPASIRPDAARIEQTTGKVAGARGFLAWLFAATGRTDSARAILSELRRLPEAFPWILIGAEAACILGDAALAEELYALLGHQAAKNSLFWGSAGAAVFGPAERILGDVARLLGRSVEAREWYEKAIALGERMNAPQFVTLARRGLAALGEARAVERSVPPPPPSPSPSPSPSTSKSGGAISAIELRRAGEMWTVTSSTGITVHLKDSKGLSYLSHLVERPGQELHVTQLSELTDVPGDAGTVLDARAKAAYKARLEALRDQLEEAERFGDPTRADAARTEMDAIARQLAGAVGLGGRDRTIGSHVERIRINVQRRLRDAIQRIEESDPALGRYLAKTIKTGNFCSFSPL